jgi:biotin carboxyl carrier protein
MKYTVRLRNRSFAVEVEGDAPRYTLSIDGRRLDVDAARLGDESLLSVLLDHESFLAHVVAADARRGLFDVSIGGKAARLKLLDELAALAEQLHAPEARGRFVLAAPMPGLVVDVRVQPGDRVEAGTALLVMEAMKMQNELASELAGTVREVHVRVNQAVETGTPLVVVESDDAGG